MFSPVLKAARRVAFDKENIDGDSRKLSPQCLPEKYSLEQFYDEVVKDEGDERRDDDLAKLLALDGCLSDENGLVHTDDDSEYAKKLSLWISKAILPTQDVVSEDETQDDTKTTSSPSPALLLVRRKSISGLHALKSLAHLYPSSLQDPGILLALITFTSTRDPWTTSTCYLLSVSLLADSPVKTKSQSPDFIISYLLQTFIRPLFSKSKPDSITAAGRKAIPSSAPRKIVDFSEVERANRAWKYDTPYAITVLHWVILNGPHETLRQNWPLFIPPLLTLLDDPTTHYRIRGLRLFTSFLPHLTPTILEQSGLFSVFENAIMPFLSSLPSLTPVEESVALLPPAYEALFTLCDVRYPTTGTTPTIPQRQNKISTLTKVSAKDEKRDPTLSPRLIFLTQILTSSLLPSFLHTSPRPQSTTQYPRLTLLLLSQLRTLIPRLGLHTTKYLTPILSLLSSLLCDPFISGTEIGRSVVEAILTLQVLILNTWPRMSDAGHRVEIIKMLVVCWRCVLDELKLESSVRGQRSGGEGNDKAGEERMILEEIKKELGVVGKLLAASVEGDEDVDIDGEVRPLVERDRSVGVLFGFSEME